MTSTVIIDNSLLKKFKRRLGFVYIRGNVQTDGMRTLAFSIWLCAYGRVRERKHTEKFFGKTFLQMLQAACVRTTVWTTMWITVVPIIHKTLSHPAFIYSVCDWSNRLNHLEGREQFIANANHTSTNRFEVTTEFWCALKDLVWTHPVFLDRRKQVLGLKLNFRLVQNKTFTIKIFHLPSAFSTVPPRNHQFLY